jgi:hypothetical protein
MRLTEFFSYLKHETEFDKMTHLTVSKEMKKYRKQMGGRRSQSISEQENFGWTTSKGRQCGVTK